MILLEEVKMNCGIRAYFEGGSFGIKLAILRALTDYVDGRRAIV